MGSSLALVGNDVAPVGRCMAAAGSELASVGNSLAPKGRIIVPMCSDLALLGSFDGGDWQLRWRRVRNFYGGDGQPGGFL